MADDPTPTTTPAVPTVFNGNVVKTKYVLVLGGALAVCLFTMTGIAVTCLVHPPQDWQLVNKVIESMNGLALMLAGGLLGATRPSGST